MKVIAQSKENLTMSEVYSLTRSPKTRKMSDAVGVVITPAAWIVYKDEQNTKEGEVKEVKVLSMIADDGEIYATNSATFMKEFEYIVNMCADFATPCNIEVVAGTSKAGRSFVTCAYVEV